MKNYIEHTLLINTYKQEKEIERLLENAQSYFGKEETIYVYECKKCHKLDPVPVFVIGEHLGFLKFIKKKDTPKMECPYCNSTMIPIKNFK